MRNDQGRAGRAGRAHEHIVAGYEDILVHRDAGECGLAAPRAKTDGVVRCDATGRDGTAGYLLRRAGATRFAIEIRRRPGVVVADRSGWNINIKRWHISMYSTRVV